MIVIVKDICLQEVEENIDNVGEPDGIHRRSQHLRCKLSNCVKPGVMIVENVCPQQVEEKRQSR